MLFVCGAPTLLSDESYVRKRANVKWGLSHSLVAARWAHTTDFFCIAVYVLGRVSRRAPREQGLLGDASPETDCHMPGHLEDVSQVTTSSRKVGLYNESSSPTFMYE